MNGHFSISDSTTGVLTPQPIRLIHIPPSPFGLYSLPTPHSPLGLDLPSPQPIRLIFAICHIFPPSLYSRGSVVGLFHKQGN